METEMIDKLFLELSQVTKAKTKRELSLEAAIRNISIVWAEYQAAGDGLAELDTLGKWIAEASRRATDSPTYS